MSFRVIIASISLYLAECTFINIERHLTFRATVAILENELLERCNVNDAK